MHNLSRALDVDASLARLEERSRHVQINEESLCHSCHARLGTKLTAMYPEDTIVCYKVCWPFMLFGFSIKSTRFSACLAELINYQKIQLFRTIL